MNSFSSSKLDVNIVNVLTNKGLLVPTEIQQKSIPVLLSHTGDFVAKSATGTGKTIAFGAPLLTRVNVDSGILQAVVLVPTRELCEQVGQELEYLASERKGLKVTSIYGGMSTKAQIHALSNGVHVVVATPGRLIDLVGRKVVDLSTLDYVIFDEADEMLLKGFKTDIDKILDKASRNFSTWLFSATIPDDINGIVKRYLKKELIRVAIGAENKTNEGIKHAFVKVTAEEKLNVLLHYLARFGSEKGIVFCRTKSGVQKLYKQLSANKFSCAALHGDLPQGLRNKVMEQYKEGQVQILIATDVAARGMDVEALSYVIQYHVPHTQESYTHRSGRTSRAGNTGVNLTMVFPEEEELLMELKEGLGIQLEEYPLPSVKDQLVNKAILWGRRIAKEKPLGEKLEDATKNDFKRELSHLSKDEILEKLLANYLRAQQGN